MIPRLTSAGKNLLLRALSGETITFSRIQLGNGAAQTPDSATALSNPIITINVSGITVGDEYVTVKGSFSNGTIYEGFRITECGIFAKDPDNGGGEILYALSNETADIADYIPPKTDKVYEMELDIIVFIGEAQNVAAAINDSLVYASASDFNDHINNKNNPHEVNKAQVGLGNVPNVATNDQTPTYTETGTLSNINSGEKLSVTFGKIKKALSTLIAHLNNKDNPHGVTASQVGAASSSHNHSTSDFTTGILGTPRGGTGIASPAVGSLLKGNGQNPLAELRGTGALYSPNVGDPQFGVLPVEWGGTGQTTVSALAESLSGLGGIPKAIAGSYTGNGGDTATLNFASPPKFVVVCSENNGASDTVPTYSDGYIIAIRGTTKTDILNSQGIITMSWSGNSVSWTITNSSQVGGTAEAWLNFKGYTYRYFAIL